MMLHPVVIKVISLLPSAIVFLVKEWRNARIENQRLERRLALLKLGAVLGTVLIVATAGIVVAILLRD
ncbi:MAG: hypothetical protein OXI74_14095 [Rhodospirillaceae bacterium]|nr:hypothetical protein [Rhodospirillaceae bacterium]